MTLFLLRSLAFLSILLGIFSLGEAAYASVSLSVTPLEGGSGIRFGRVSTDSIRDTKQVRIRVNSDNVKQYQVYQRVQEPILNEKGQSLNLSAIQVASQPNSNTSGTLYLQNVDNLSHGDQLIYTSGRGGEGDSFTLAYNAIPDLLNGSGNFRGRIVFTVRTLGGEQNESTVDFFLENASQLEASVGGSRDRNLIRIQNIEQLKAEFIRLSYSNNGSEEIKIYQEILSPLADQTGKQLALDVIQMNLQGNNSNGRVGDGSLSRSRTLIYSGNSSEDEFAIYFLVDSEKAKKLDAGLYKGQLKYTFEAGANRKEFNINIEYDVPPVFTIDVTFPPEGMRFGHVLPSSPPEERQVLVVVNTNLHKPYQIVQNITSLMTNEKGEQFDKQYLTFNVDLSREQKGRTKFADYSPVEIGEYPIYYSDAEGSPVMLLVNYQLKGYTGMGVGRYLVPVKFFLSQN